MYILLILHHYVKLYICICFISFILTQWKNCNTELSNGKKGKKRLMFYLSEGGEGQPGMPIYD